MRVFLGYIGVYVLIVASATPGACARQVQNEKISNQNKGYICNYAVIRSEGRKGASVYYQPDSKSKNEGKLEEGTPVYICDEAKDWTKIYYGNLCVKHFTGGLASTEAKSQCLAGWVKRLNLEVLSG